MMLPLEVQFKILDYCVDTDNLFHLAKLRRVSTAWRDEIDYQYIDESSSSFSDAVLKSKQNEMDTCSSNALKAVLSYNWSKHMLEMTEVYQDSTHCSLKHDLELLKAMHGGGIEEFRAFAECISAKILHLKNVKVEVDTLVSLTQGHEQYWRDNMSRWAALDAQCIQNFGVTAKTSIDRQRPLNIDTYYSPV